MIGAKVLGYAVLLMPIYYILIKKIEEKTNQTNKVA
jgi:hypothetical protein